jgi:hypothetical protein
MEDLFHIRPPASAGNIHLGQWFLAWFAEGPPFPGARVGGHGGHISGEVRTDIFEIAERQFEKLARAIGALSC